MGESRNVRVNRILTGMYDAERQLGRLRCRWKDNVGIAVKDIV
jgi:3'-phosphoadenosine 5'-phosphosulfate sulfotransferase